MALLAAFAECTITPPIGTRKVGWLRFDTTDVSDTIRDELFARVAVLQSDGVRVAIVSLDVLSIRWTQVNNIRRRIEAACGFPGSNIMIAATHNHAGPATVNLADSRRDESYLRFLEDSVVKLVLSALDKLQEAQIGFGHTYEWEVAYNRRVVMRDGTAKMKGSFTDPDSLCVEGPIDPECAVLAVKALTGEKLGVIVNFACHPIHHGGDTVISAGYPGALALEMGRRGWPVTLFLNGAAGNISHSDPAGNHPDRTHEEVGKTLAGDAEKVISALEYTNVVSLGCQSRTIRLPFRRITADELRGTTRGAQRSVEYSNSDVYERDLASTVAKIRSRKFNLAEMQVIRLNEVAVAAVPAELFVENGLMIKEKAFPRHAIVVSYANGAVGYVPHRQAFLRGGYETTFAGWSRLAPSAGEIIIDSVVDLVKNIWAQRGRK